MPYDLTTRDGITIRNIPDNIPQDSLELKARVEKIRRGEEQGTPSNVEQIPTAGAPVAPPPDGSIRPGVNAGIVDTAIGTGEAALSMATGATGGALGAIGGTLKGLAEQILSGNFGTPEAAKLVEQSAMSGAQALTYEPRTPSGQAQAQAVGSAMQQLIPVAPVLPGLMPAAAGARSAAPAGVVARAGAEGLGRAVAGEAGASAVASGIDAGSRVANLAASKATTLPRRALEALSREPESTATPGTRGSMGAAGTDMANQRRATAENLGFTGDRALTSGQSTRDPAQLKFERETAKMPGEGAPLRERVNAQNEHILSTFDDAVYQTGAEAPSLRATGIAVDKALVDQFKRDKTRVNAAYAEAKRSPEAQAIVDPNFAVALGDGPEAITSTPFSFLNEQPTGVPSSALADAARQYAVRRGIAEVQDGQLVPRPSTIRQMEDWRSDISQATGYERPDIRTATILKGLIDGQTEPVAGPLYRQARATRRRLAQNYEDRAAIAKLLNNKRGTSDRQVALEDVFSHSILRGSLDDIRNIRRVLQRDAQGAQAWKELQGATAGYIRDQATSNVATNASGSRVVSPAKLDRAIRELDADGRLDFIFGKRGAQTMRDINDLAQYALTVPPEAAINTSNTASTMLAAFADLGLSGASGIPVPLATAAKLARGHIKDARLRRRVEDALNDIDRRRSPNR